ncbi:hypothetical protein AVEN_165646-1 [Araneus ventricosus]|uniref:Uncharacterized protein n=1 Tax=Araneus ventricosus TaxID=182803 RepID=A0A4Y2U6B4_ARAVE|nr:hypothetical protein AVEN_165646-1 [Araneus ventricosus]
MSDIPHALPGPPDNTFDPPRRIHELKLAADNLRIYEILRCVPQAAGRHDAMTSSECLHRLQRMTLCLCEILVCRLQRCNLILSDIPPLV